MRKLEEPGEDGVGVDALFCDSETLRIGRELERYGMFPRASNERVQPTCCGIGTLLNPRALVEDERRPERGHGMRDDSPLSGDLADHKRHCDGNIKVVEVADRDAFRKYLSEQLDGEAIDGRHYCFLVACERHRDSPGLFVYAADLGFAIVAGLERTIAWGIRSKERK